MTHPLLVGDPQLAKLAREVARLDEAAVADSARRDAASTGYWQAVARHADLAEAALLAGKEAPSKPQVPALAGDPGVFHGRRQALAARRQEVLAERAPVLLRALCGREEELLEAARNAAQLLAAVGAECQEIAHAVAAVRHAAGDPTPTYRHSIDAGVLLTMLAQGGRPSAPARSSSGDPTSYRVSVS